MIFTYQRRKRTAPIQRAITVCSWGPTPPFNTMFTITWTKRYHLHPTSSTYETKHLMKWWQFNDYGNDDYDNDFKKKKAKKLLQSCYSASSSVKSCILTECLDVFLSSSISISKNGSGVTFSGCNILGQATRTKSSSEKTRKAIYTFCMYYITCRRPGYLLQGIELENS